MKKNVHRNKLRKILFQKEYSYWFFKDSERTLYFTLAEKFARVVKTATYVALEDFEGKNVWNLAHCFNFLWTLSQKTQAFYGKFLSGFSQVPLAGPDEYFAEKKFFFRRNFVFCMNFGAAAFFCPLANMLSRWVKTAMHVFRGKVCGKFTSENCFFYLFGLWAEKIGLCI